MQTLSVTGDLQIPLHRLRVPAQLCDESGQALGGFTPTGAARYQGVNSPTDVEELRPRQLPAAVAC